MKYEVPSWKPSTKRADVSPCGGISVDLSCPDVNCLQCPRYKPRVNRTVIDEQWDINEDVNEYNRGE